MDDASYIPFGGESLGRHGGKQANRTVYFNRLELTKILNVYGRMVSGGNWRDYAIDHLRDEAIFSVFRRTSEMPLYRIIKEPALAREQGMWRIMGMDGQILKRGRDLEQLLKYFDRQLLRAID